MPGEEIADVEHRLEIVLILPFQGDRLVSIGDMHMINNGGDLGKGYISPFRKLRMSIQLYCFVIGRRRVAFTR